FGRQGVGRDVFLGELLHRLAVHSQGLSLFYLVPPNDRQAARDMLRQDEEFVGKTDVAGAVQTVWLLTDRATDPAFAAATDLFDATAYFNPLLAVQGLWPAVDPLLSQSRFLDASRVGPEHVETARRVRETLARAKETMTDPVFLELAALGATAQAARRASEFAQARLPALSPEDRLLVARARKLQRFFTQPFFVAEPYTSTPGKWVSRAETIQACQAILDGDADALPEESFRFVGNWSEAAR
ncbi:MAG: hypothetical protein M3Y13_00635, partial [Armatimonadota bacterium]|nr:hypothetical protein [Armatimonadota bacterium]